MLYEGMILITNGIKYFIPGIKQNVFVLKNNILIKIMIILLQYIDII